MLNSFNCYSRFLSARLTVFTLVVILSSIFVSFSAPQLFRPLLISAYQSEIADFKAVFTIRKLKLNTIFSH